MRFRLRWLTDFEIGDPKVVIHHGMIRRLGCSLLNKMQGLARMSQFMMNPSKRIEENSVWRSCFKVLRKDESSLQALLIAFLVRQERRQIIRSDDVAGILHQQGLVFLDRPVDLSNVAPCHR